MGDGLLLEDVDAWYGSAHVLFGVGFEVPADSFTVLLGRNGAGKSTTLKSIMGIECRSTGTMTFDGVPLGPMRTHQRARLGLQLVPEDRRVYTELTVRQNLRLARQATGGRTALDVGDLVRSFPTLEPLLQRTGMQLSGGEQQLVAIARALVARPRLLMMDEPSQGLAPVILDSLADSIQVLRREFGTTVLLSEQNVQFAERLADDVIVIDEGRISFVGDAAEFARDADRKRQLLGL